MSLTGPGVPHLAALPGGSLPRAGRAPRGARQQVNFCPIVTRGLERIRTPKAAHSTQDPLPSSTSPPPTSPSCSPSHGAPCHLRSAWRSGLRPDLHHHHQPPGPPPAPGSVSFSAGLGLGPERRWPCLHSSGPQPPPQVSPKDPQSSWISPHSRATRVDTSPSGGPDLGDASSVPRCRVTKAVPGTVPWDPLLALS